jgi:hypothetical protein
MPTRPNLNGHLARSSQRCSSFANIGILGHLATEEGEVTQDQWQYVESNLISIHGRLEALWSAAWEQHKAEHQAHEETLAEAKALTAAPGSKADIERAQALWVLLRSAATVTLRRCDEAMPAEKLIRSG